MTTNAPLALPQTSKNNLTVIFAPAGVGKTTLIGTLFAKHLFPKDGEVRFLALDPNAEDGLVSAIKTYNVVLEPGQLTIARPKKDDGSAFEATLRSCLKTARAKAQLPSAKPDPKSGRELVDRLEDIIELLIKFEGIDVATGKAAPPTLSKDFKENTVLVIDSWTQFVLELTSGLNQENLLQPEQRDWNQMNNAVSSILATLASLPCKVVILTHCDELILPKSDKPNDVALHTVLPVFGTSKKNKDLAASKCSNVLFMQTSNGTRQIRTKSWTSWGDPFTICRSNTINSNHAGLKVSTSEDEYTKMPGLIFSLAQLLWGKPLETK